MAHINLQLFLLLFFILNTVAQNNIIKPGGLEIYEERIGTIQFSQSGAALSFPVINLYESGKLELKFDLLTSNDEQLYYYVELCNSDWEPAELDEMEYINGFPENTFDAFSHSINTTVDYMHYKLELPNDDIQFLKSGNYILHIYREGERNNKVLSRRFVVYETESVVEVRIDKFQSGIYSDRQELNVTVAPQSIAFDNLVGNISLSVVQNNNWSSSQNFSKYNTDGEGKIVFNNPGQIVFNGLNEFRFFDIKSLKFISEHVDYIEYKAPNYHVYLKPDKLRGDKNYFYNADLNGLFYLWNQETRDDDLLDADYVFVHFKLETGIPFPADIYIEGAITDWKYTDNYLSFNPESGVYEKALFLKQGIYSYRYVAREYNTNKVESDITEGNYYQTGNDYIAFLYYRALGDVHDRVIGIGTLSTGEAVKEYDKNEKPNAIQRLLKEIAPR